MEKIHFFTLRIDLDCSTALLSSHFCRGARLGLFMNNNVPIFFSSLVKKITHTQHRFFFFFFMQAKTKRV